ncbi:uncharacterized protein LOC124134024 [Haliotis rufescens]|uniref:uncharacterized protein LOC124134024 n=1 Tax=Haliotis rufescens TaxID=6454 RepID=UPI001EB07E1B|nr:uncharacterized protein LOC124134024 [Haliotis rufescens]
MLSCDIVHVFVVAILLVDISVAAPFQIRQATCSDHLSFCEDFKGWGCGGQYEEWASFNCANTCGYCNKKGFVIPHNPFTVTHTVPSHQCVDKISNCKEYGLSTCTLYKAWAQTNCASMCGLCDLVIG